MAVSKFMRRASNSSQQFSIRLYFDLFQVKYAWIRFHRRNVQHVMLSVKEVQRRLGVPWEPVSSTDKHFTKDRIK